MASLCVGPRVDESTTITPRNVQCEVCQAGVQPARDTDGRCRAAGGAAEHRAEDWPGVGQAAGQSGQPGRYQHYSGN